MQTNLEAFATRDALMDGVAGALADAVNEALVARSAACVALSGGSTPAPAYERLATRACGWGKVTFVLVDERFVPPGDPASNEGLCRRTLAPAAGGAAAGDVRAGRRPG
jgi:6-phosphogluconolactonase